MFEEVHSILGCILIDTLVNESYHFSSIIENCIPFLKIIN